MNTIKNFDQLINEGNDIIGNEEHSEFLSVVKDIMPINQDMKIDCEVDPDNYFTLTFTAPHYECTIVGLAHDSIYPNAIFADWYKDDKHLDIRGNEEIKSMLADNYPAFIQKLTSIITEYRK